jgi:RNA polymerase sigma-70 factor (ECF subfamily)
MAINENTAVCPQFSLDLSVTDRPEDKSAHSGESVSEKEFNELYKSYGPLVHGVLLAKLPVDEVQDVLQEVFLAAYKSLHSLRDKNATGAWLIKIARNHIADFYRRSRQTEELSETFESRDGGHSNAQEILRTIRSMADPYRETLILRLVEGMTGEEIAKCTGLTPDSVRVNLHRGMKKLREKLGTRI